MVSHKVFLNVSRHQHVCTCLSQSSLPRSKRHLSTEKNNFAARRNVTSNLDFVILWSWDIGSEVFKNHNGKWCSNDTRSSDFQTMILRVTQPDGRRGGAGSRVVGRCWLLFLAPTTHSDKLTVWGLWDSLCDLASKRILQEKERRKIPVLWPLTWHVSTNALIF